MSHRYRAATLVLLCLSLPALALGVMHRTVLPVAFEWLDVGEEPQPADAVFVLLGNADVRPFVAAAIYRAGLVPRVLVAVHDNPLIRGHSYWPQRHVVYLSVLQHRGVPREDIVLLGEGSNSTKDEIDALGNYLRQHPDANVLMVTSHFHTRRSRWTLRRRLGDLAQRVRIVSSPEDQFDAENWWLSKEGFVLVSMEYLKLLAYWYFYGNGVIISLVVAALGLAAGWRWRSRKQQLAVESVAA
jgi:uncharacterized SAM-binding protein YcdF (DUF218 family)